jgi:hypothetical protein
MDNLERVVSLSDNKDEMTEVVKKKLLHWKKSTNKIQSLFHARFLVTH